MFRNGKANKSRDNHDWKLSINGELSARCEWQAVSHSKKRVLIYEGQCGKAQGGEETGSCGMWISSGKEWMSLMNVVLIS